MKSHRVHTLYRGSLYPRSADIHGRKSANCGISGNPLSWEYAFSDPHRNNPCRNGSGYRLPSGAPPAEICCPSCGIHDRENNCPMRWGRAQTFYSWNLNRGSRNRQYQSSSASERPCGHPRGKSGSRYSPPKQPPHEHSFRWSGHHDTHCSGH